MQDDSCGSSFEILAEDDDYFQQSDQDDQPSSDQELIKSEMLNEKLAGIVENLYEDETVLMGFVDTCEQSDEDVEDIKNLDQELPKCPDQNSDRMAPFETEASSADLQINFDEPKIRHSFARLCQQHHPSTALTYNNMLGNVFRIPCPKCQEADCIWHCQKM